MTEPLRCRLFTHSYDRVRTELTVGGEWLVIVDRCTRCGRENYTRYHVGSVEVGA